MCLWQVNITAEPFCLPTYNAGYSTGLNIIHVSIMKKDSAVIFPSGQVAQRFVFPSFPHLSSQLQSELAPDPQAIDSDTPFCCHAKCPPLSCIKSCSENPGPHKSEGRDGVTPSELAPVVQCHRCSRGKHVHVSLLTTEAPVLGLGSVQTASVVYMQKYIILLKLDCNNPKHSEEASGFSFCNL